MHDTTTKNVIVAPDDKFSGRAATIERLLDQSRTLQAYLGHKNIQHTVRYTELSATRFKGLWD
jgi:hypothetical protein